MTLETDPQSSEVQITPTAVAEAPLITFNIVGIGKFDLPVLGSPGVPFGITSAFGQFESSRRTGTSQQKLTAWTRLIDTLADTYPDAVRVIARLGGDDIAEIFKQWGKKSREHTSPAR